MKLFICIVATIFLSAADWPPPKSPAVPTADGYVTIPGAVLSPTSATQYQAVFDATRAASKPTELVPAINMAGSELNALAAINAPLSNAKFAIVFHGSAVDGILDNEHYKAKFGADNPNLEVIKEMKKAGVEVFVCGQFGRGEDRSEDIVAGSHAGGGRATGADALPEQGICPNELQTNAAKAYHAMERTADRRTLHFLR